MSAFAWKQSLALAATLLTVGGCGAFQRSNSSLASTPAQKNDASLATLGEPSNVEITETKPKTTTPAKSTLDHATLQELMAELKDLGETDPEAQRELIALVEGDPAMAGPIMRVWRESLKHKKLSASDDRGTLAAETTARADSPSAKPTRASLRPELSDSSGTKRPVRTVALNSDELSGDSSFPGLEEEGRFEDLINAAPATPRSARPRGDSDWDSHVQQLIRETQAALASDSATDSTQMQVYLRLLYLMAGQREKAIAPIEGVDRAEADYWKHALWAMSNHFDTAGLPNGPERASESLKQLLAAAEQLRAKASLEVKNLNFCQRIQSYGTFERFPGHPNYELSPGREVLLYAEVENFHSELTQDKQYRTVLGSTIAIVDDQDQELWRQQFEPTEDYCQNRRQDYFHTYKFAIPAKLKPGEYTVKLTVDDQLAEKSAEGTISFQVR